MDTILNLLSGVIPSLISVFWLHLYLKAKKRFPGKIRVRETRDLIPAVVIIGYGLFVFPLAITPFFGKGVLGFLSIDYSVDTELTLISIFIFHLIFYLTYWFLKIKGKRIEVSNR